MPTPVVTYAITPGTITGNDSAYWRVGKSIVSRILYRVDWHCPGTSSEVSGTGDNVYPISTIDGIVAAALQKKVSTGIKSFSRFIKTV